MVDSELVKIGAVVDAIVADTVVTKVDLMAVVKGFVVTGIKTVVPITGAVVK